MTKQRHEDEDDDHRLLRDGEFLRVPMMMRDGSMGHLSPVQREVAMMADALQRDEAAALRFNLSDTAMLHRPGYRHSINDVALDAKAKAYADDETDLVNAWQHGASVLVPPAGPAQSTRDVLADAYATYDHYISDAWRNSAPAASGREANNEHAHA